MTSARLRAIDESDWRAWCATPSSLPIACDPSWVDATLYGYASRFRARFWLCESNGDECLVVGYEEGNRLFPTLTLSPFGLASAIAARAGLPPYADVLAALFRQYSHRYRSIAYLLPFYAPEVGRYPASAGKEPFITHVLDLKADGCKSSSCRRSSETRRCVRVAAREGVKVVVTTDPAGVRDYYSIHLRLAEIKGGYSDLHPPNFLRALVAAGTRCELALSVIGDQPVAGGIFLDDGPSMFYWHGAGDRAFRRIQPTYALLDHMIGLAKRRGKPYFNMGGSAGIRTLEQFKESWGATPRRCPTGSATNPVIRTVKSVLHKPS